MYRYPPIDMSTSTLCIATFMEKMCEDNKTWSPLFGGFDPLPKVINRAVSTWGRYEHEVTIETQWPLLRRHLTLRTTVLYNLCDNEPY